MTSWTVAPIFFNDQNAHNLKLLLLNSLFMFLLKSLLLIRNFPIFEFFPAMHQKTRLERISRIALVTGDSSQPYRW